ncbi:MAG TPA: ion channel [Intrasporangium sp.]|nr:ion channel [Intrasporangium sp.]
MQLPSALLLVVQLAAIVAVPFLETATLGGFRQSGRVLVGLVGLVVLLLAVRAVRVTPAPLSVALILGLSAAGLAVAQVVLPDSAAVLLWSSLLHAAFYGYTAYALLRYMFADTWVTRDEVYATGAAFAVFAWAFAHLYVAVQVLWPHSFAAHGQAGTGERSWYQLLFLSFQTMTGAGPSDIIPVTEHARSFVMVEQVCGMLFVALVVARVVGLTIARFK